MLRGIPFLNSSYAFLPLYPKGAFRTNAPFGFSGPGGKQWLGAALRLRARAGGAQLGAKEKAIGFAGFPRDERALSFSAKRLV